MTAFHLWTPLPGKGKRRDRCCAWSDAVIRPAFDAAGTQPPAWWEFADRVQITRSVLEAQWKALVVPAPSRHCCAILSFRSPSRPRDRGQSKPPRSEFCRCHL